MDTFEILDGFFITGRGLVLLGHLTGSISPGQHLILPDRNKWLIRAVEDVWSRQQELHGLLVEADIASRSQLLELDIIGRTALIS